MSSLFEGSYLGDDSKLSDTSRLECGICWYVYDPATGDDVAQIPAGTPFSQLPDHWRCPNCDAEKHKFLLLDEASAGSAKPEPVERLEAAFGRIALTMTGLPIYHPALAVEAVGFREHEDRQVGVLVTPWFMNLVVLPSEKDRDVWRSGGTVRLAFPSGRYDFLVSEVEELGLLGSCALFSPMSDFADQEAARIAAQAAADGVFEQDERADPADQKTVSRRDLLKGGHSGSD